ncbi:hypothetical protein NL288_27010, partial [Klebsiella pneumoniae]|nr:hypothetical protein [Klebsiella pneumoniae]
IFSCGHEHFYQSKPDKNCNLYGLYKQSKRNIFSNLIRVFGIKVLVLKKKKSNWSGLLFTFDFEKVLP